MKKVLLLVTVLTLNVNLFSQVLEKGFSDTTLWHMHSGFVWIEGPGGPMHTENFDEYRAILKDTIINDTLFQKLYYMDSLFDVNTISFLGYFKTVNHRVFYGTDIDSMKIMYDYNLCVGDTFRFNSYNNLYEEISYLVKVAVVDTIFINNKFRKRIEFEEFQDTGNFCSAHKKVVWVEGFGDYNYGLIHDYGVIMFCACQVQGNSELACFNENNVPLIGDCVLYTDIDESKALSTFRLYPNPASNRVYANYSLKNISFFNQLGTKEIEISTRQSQFDVSKLPEGVHFYRAVTDDNKVVTGKIVIVR